MPELPDRIDEPFNGIVVRYTNRDGMVGTVGPPGSLADVTSTLLIDGSPENPVNAHGIPRRWVTVHLSQPMTDVGAIAVGQFILGQQTAPARTDVAEGATAHGYVRLSPGAAARLLDRLIPESVSHGAEAPGMVWRFIDCGLRLYLADRPAIPELPYELSVEA